MPTRRLARLAVWSGGGLASGLAIGAVVAIAATAGTLGPGSAKRARDQLGLLTATHLPPLLTLAGDPVELRYDIYCNPPASSTDADAPCDGGGTVFARRGSSGVFTAIPLQIDPAATEGRYVASVPNEIADSAGGFQYYAVIRDNSTGQTTTVPDGGQAAPQWSRPLSRTIKIDLDSALWRTFRRPNARVVSATWGTSKSQVGLEGGTQQAPIGGSAFDVDGTGTVTLLDQVNRRALRFAPSKAPVAIPLAISGREADMSVEPDGTIDVLETVGAEQQYPILKRFSSTGKTMASLQVGDPFAAVVRIALGRPVVLQYPSSQWIPVVARAGRLARRPLAARPGLTFRGGSEVVVDRVGDEARIALLSSGTVERSWRIVSDSPLAEVQLAQPVGDRLVAVVRAYDDSEDRFAVLVLDGQGLVSGFWADSADWAETAPLSRFRLVRSSLYQLGSTSKGLSVDRYDLEVS
jgi:hypothetical protein